MSKDELIITKHGRKRSVERLGINKKSVDKNADKAYEFGITHKEAKGALEKYMTKQFLIFRQGNNMRVYNRHLYIFQENRLLTVLLLPNNLWKIEDAIKEKRNGKKNTEIL